MAEKQERKYAPDEVNEFGEYIKIGGSPVPGITLRQVLRGHTDKINRISWSPDGRFLASPSSDKTIQIWDIRRGKSVAVLKGHEAVIYCAAWSPDGRLLASGDTNKNLEIWDPVKGELISTLKGHQNFV